jgi:hypothetical protein
MTCFYPQPKYANPPFRGIAFANSKSDGHNLELRWFQAFSPSTQYQVAYNIYYSTFREDVFKEGVKFVSIDPKLTIGNVTELTPGDQYFFAVRAALHEISKNQLDTLPTSNDFHIYSEGVLLNNVGLDDLIIYASDVDTFPPIGIIQIGGELMFYTSVDLLNSALILAPNGRGFYGSNIRIHNTDGYDGYYVRDPLVHYFKGFEDDNISIIAEENKFSYPDYPRTNSDGYRDIDQTSVLVTDFAGADADQIGFRPFDFAGYRRTDPAMMLSGDCVGSYYGGEYYCADGYGRVGEQVRGLSISEVNNHRQEVLLDTDGEPCVLVKRLWSGKTCSCMDSSREIPDPRCPNCFGTSFVTGYEQYFFPRRSDGRIMVRFDPSVEDLIPQESGLESTFGPNAWTLTVPAIRDRDFLIRFAPDGVTEEYRYEVLKVTRNKILLNDYGAQKLELVRIRKTDPIYQVRTFRNTATMPQTITTNIGFVPGPGGIPPHVHSVKISENIMSLSQINQTTGTAQGHNHPVINGVVMPVLGHNHLLIL